MTMTRAELPGQLHLSPTSPTKTFVLDVHTSEPAAYLAELVGSNNVEPTADASLFGAYLPEGAFWVDQLDSRFWAFHTDMPAADARRFLHAAVESRRDLDWMWLPSEHLRHADLHRTPVRVRTAFSGQQLLGPGASTSRLNLQASGSGAEALLEYLARNEEYRAAVSLEGVQLEVGDVEAGRLTEAVNRLGRFAASGDSLELHLQFVRGVVSRYAAFVHALEGKAIGWDALAPEHDGGGTVTGQPVLISFSRTIPDLDGFAAELFASRHPFRLWGVPEIVRAGSDDHDVIEVDAVDLHVGQRLRMDIGRTWMRVYLERGSCGNTVARLVSNLQHRFDGALELKDQELQADFVVQRAAYGALAN
jgi:hypothetical protein